MASRVDPGTSGTGSATRARVAFYTSYANAWLDNIPPLRRDHEPDSVGERFPRFWHVQNQPTGTDVLRGRVLSPHLLSGFFTRDRALVAVAGRVFGTPTHVRVFECGEGGVPEYWNLVGAIPTAGHLHHRALDRRAARQGGRDLGAAGRAVDRDTTSAHGSWRFSRPPGAADVRVAGARGASVASRPPHPGRTSGSRSRARRAVGRCPS